MTNSRFYFGRFDTLRSRIARKPGLFTLVFIAVLLFMFKPTRIATGYLIPSAVRVEIADWYASIWEDKNWRNTLVIPLDEHPLADTVCFLYDQDSFIVMKLFQNRNGVRRTLQYIRPTDLPIVAIDKIEYEDSTVEILHYFHRKRIHKNIQRNAPKRSFSKEQLQLDAKELFSLYQQFRPMFLKPE